MAGTMRERRPRQDHRGHQRHAAGRRRAGAAGHPDGRVDVHRGADPEGAAAAREVDRRDGRRSRRRSSSSRAACCAGTRSRSQEPSSPNKMKAAVTANPEMSLVVSADKEVMHGNVVHVLDLAKLAGDHQVRHQRPANRVGSRDVKLGTVIVSTALHVGLAAGLITVAERKGLGKKTISVAVTGEKKKQDKPKPPRRRSRSRGRCKSSPRFRRPMPRSLPRPRRRPRRSSPTWRCRTPTSTSAPASACTAGRRPPPPPRRPRSPRRSPRPAPGAPARTSAAGADAPCEEEPTKPEPLVKTPIDYTSIRRRRPTASRGSSRRGSSWPPDGEVSDVEVLVQHRPGVRRRRSRRRCALALQAGDGLRQARRRRLPPVHREVRAGRLRWEPSKGSQTLPR